MFATVFSSLCCKRSKILDDHADQDETEPWVYWHQPEAHSNPSLPDGVSEDLIVKREKREKVEYQYKNLWREKLIKRRTKGRGRCIAVMMNKNYIQYMVTGIVDLAQDKKLAG
jgi:hypothetical protein